MYRSCMSTFQINNRITVLLAKLPGLPLPSLPLPILPLPTLPTPPKNGCRIFRLTSFPLPSLPFTVLVNDTRWPNKQIDFTEHNVMVIVINSPVSGSWYCFQHVCVSVCVCVCVCACVCVCVSTNQKVHARAPRDCICH